MDHSTEKQKHYYLKKPLKIYFADPARVVFTPSVQYIPRGLKGMIRCETDANPPITYITWKKDSRLFDPFIKAGIMALLNGSLLIDQVSKPIIHLFGDIHK